MQFDNKEQPLFLSPQWTQERKKNNTHTHTYEKNGNTCPTHLPPHCNAPHPDRKPILVCIPLNYLKIFKNKFFFKFKKYFFERQSNWKTKRGKVTEIFHLLLHFPNICNNCEWAKLKLNPELHLGPHTSGRDPIPVLIRTSVHSSSFFLNEGKQDLGWRGRTCSGRQTRQDQGPEHGVSAVSNKCWWAQLSGNLLQISRHENSEDSSVWAGQGSDNPGKGVCTLLAGTIDKQYTDKTYNCRKEMTGCPQKGKPGVKEVT